MMQKIPGRGNTMGLSNEQGRSIFDRYRRFHYGTAAAGNQDDTSAAPQQQGHDTQTNMVQQSVQSHGKSAAAAKRGAHHDDPNSPFHTPRIREENQYNPPLGWSEDPFPSPVFSTANSHAQQTNTRFWSPSWKEGANGASETNTVTQINTSGDRSGSSSHPESREKRQSKGSRGSSVYNRTDDAFALQQYNASDSSSKPINSNGRSPHGSEVSKRPPWSNGGEMTNPLSSPHEQLQFPSHHFEQFSLDQLMQMYRETQESVERLRDEVEKAEADLHDEAKDATERTHWEKEKLRRQKEQLEDYHSEEMTDLAKMTQMAQRKETTKLESALRVAEAKHRDFLQEQAQFSSEAGNSQFSDTGEYLPYPGDDDHDDDVEVSSIGDQSAVQRGQGLRSPDIEKNALPKKASGKKTWLKERIASPNSG
eukprot:gb/GECG01009055.1/.p1 GENE.gb/GECG01009055.1/~~gb/GECG01009055.1/.p1  ORF type:complete len:423 (+),score=64.25 gb/GECG01009055.1/:1-1269(+)